MLFSGVMFTHSSFSHQELTQAHIFFTFQAYMYDWAVANQTQQVELAGVFECEMSTLLIFTCFLSDFGKVVVWVGSPSRFCCGYTVLGVKVPPSSDRTPLASNVLWVKHSIDHALPRGAKSFTSWTFVCHTSAGGKQAPTRKKKVYSWNFALLTKMFSFEGN